MGKFNSTLIIILHFHNAFLVSKTDFLSQNIFNNFKNIFNKHKYIAIKVPKLVGLKSKKNM